MISQRKDLGLGHLREFYRKSPSNRQQIYLALLLAKSREEAIDFVKTSQTLEPYKRECLFYIEHVDAAIAHTLNTQEAATQRDYALTFRMYLLDAYHEYCTVYTVLGEVYVGEYTKQFIPWYIATEDSDLHVTKLTDSLTIIERPTDFPRALAVNMGNFFDPLYLPPQTHK